MSEKLKINEPSGFEVSVKTDQDKMKLVEDLFINHLLTDSDLRRIIQIEAAEFVNLFAAVIPVLYKEKSADLLTDMIIGRLQEI